ncbi:hypothetical protein ACEN2I_17665 [Flavobacterium sp. W22_SRS_FK3]
MIPNAIQGKIVDSPLTIESIKILKDQDLKKKEDLINLGVKYFKYQTNLFGDIISETDRVQTDYDYFQDYGFSDPTFYNDADDYMI